MLGIGCVILLWHFLGIPYNHLRYIDMKTTGLDIGPPSSYTGYGKFPVFGCD